MRLWPIVIALVLAGCAEERSASSPPPRATPDASAEAPPRVERAHCAADAGNCAAVTGRVLYVERVDPDGDGDAHYVLAGGNVTARGISVIDVGRELRPPRLPRLGDVVSAAGPVFTGSYGQRQIEATEIHHQRR
jgi:hypothetical protein